MPEIICYHCFARFPPQALQFKCVWHQVEDPLLGPGAPLVFGWRSRSWQRLPPRSVICPEDGLLTSYRICPTCGRDLPYYVGRLRQEIIAITGCQRSGKTVFLWGLLHQLRERLARDPHPYVVAMFEDDEGSRIYHELSEAILVHNELPEATQAVGQRHGEVKPVIVRLLLEGRGAVTNLIFYDHAGELIQVIDDVCYLRYLAHASALIYLVDPTNGQDGRADAEAASLASESLSHIAKQLREELGLSKRGRIPKKLAVVVTKGDITVFPKHSPADLIGGFGRTQDFWRRQGRADRAKIDAASRGCETVARDLGLDNLVNLARMNFTPVRFFVTACLKKVGDAGNSRFLPEPIGLEHPLFWSLMSRG